jgi:hypothetical protein
MTSARGIGFEIRPSNRLTGWLVLVVCLAAAAPLFTSLPTPLRGLLMAFVGFDGARRIRRYRHPACRHLFWAADGAWTITDRHGASSEVDLRAARRVGLGMCLSFDGRRGALHVLLCPDSTAEADLRMLRARLKRVRPQASDAVL